MKAKRPGPSPRPRGLRVEVGREGQTARPIPASAGSPHCTSPTSIPVRVDPRVRRVSRTRNWLASMTKGSSPRPRGLRGKSGKWRAAVRFIPASAGSPLAVERGLQAQRVHPRVHGVSRCTVWKCCSARGSSPRPRGLHRKEAGEERLRGFIPASAGSPRKSTPVRSMTTVHPRVRGVSASTAVQAPVVVGSSPRPRGLRWQHACGTRPLRFIPASAGSPLEIIY